MKTITYSAPAKIHLMGEHSAVHGKPALLAAIDKHLSVTVTLLGENEINDQDFESKFLEYLKVIRDAIKTTYNISEIPKHSITINSTIPIGSGMGSSAALSACYTAALLDLLKIPFNNASLFKTAYEGEKFFHGNPSGGDLAVVIEGGLLYFRKEFEFLKSFSNLDFKIPNEINNFYVINSGKPEESTLDMVKSVGELKNKYTKKINLLFADQELQTKNLVLALKDGNENLLKDSIKNGEVNLEKINVIGDTAKKMIRGIENIGGVAKISGAGGIKNGSGMILVYHPNIKTFQTFCKKNNLEFEKIKIVNFGIKKI